MTSDSNVIADIGRQIIVGNEGIGKSSESVAIQIIG